MNPLQRIVLGDILGAHGLRGEVRVRPTGDSFDNLRGAESLWLGRGLEDRTARRVAVLGGGAGRGSELRLHLEGFDDRDAAESLRGWKLMGEVGALPKLPSGEYYWHELVGCQVESESGFVAGRVQEIWETGAHDVLLVVDEQGVRRLVPTATALMKSVDLDARRIVVADLPGLLDPVA